MMGTHEPQAGTSPLLIVLAGDFDNAEAVRLLEANFTASAATAIRAFRGSRQALEDIAEHIDQPRAQARLGYIVAAPPPGEKAADAWRALQYILSHDYEGRLGHEAISRRGLVYYIDTRYRSDGQNAWITLSTGVDPKKLDAMNALLRDELLRLRREPPSDAEIAGALTHRIGRAQSAAQSNRELCDALATEWLWYGELLSVDALRARLSRVDRNDVLAAVDAFTRGAVITVSVSDAP
jgi:predicted Zn-dependent peptidase